MLNVTPSTMIWVVINLFVLYFLLRHFLFKPVMAMIESRQQEMEHNLAAAEDQRTRAEFLAEEYDSKLKNATHEASQLVSSAKKRAEQEYQTVLKRAQRDAKRLSDEAESQLEADRQSMLAGVRREVATLALLAASKVSEGEIGEAEDLALFDAFLAEVGESS